jgi:GTPase SAR1 family protein
MEGLRLVLIGLPGAGKSALLGALVQAAQSQEHVLSGKLIDRSQGLGELQKQAYQNQPRPMSEEIAAYPIAVEPMAGGLPPVEAVLIDCDGKAANEVLAQRSANGGSRALARAIRSADGLILVADAAADPAQLQRDFGQIAAFLRQFELQRSQRSEVGGLPVFLVLTKCDLLAKKTDTASAWIGRIEERKRQVDQGFQKYLAQQGGREALAFGKVDLNLWATAVGRPALADRPAKPQEPYGVAELFRQCLQEAGKFHQRRAQASRHLRMVVGGAAGLVLLMAALASAFYLTRPSAEVVALENSLRGIMPVEGASPAERLQEPLDDKLKKLRTVQSDPDFGKLSSQRQREVADFIEEIEAYKKYDKAFLNSVSNPRLAGRDEDLDKIEQAVAALPLLKAYAENWKASRAGLRRQEYLTDVKVLRTEVAAAEKWIHEQIQAGKLLEKQGFSLLAKSPTEKERETWLDQYKEFQERKMPHKASERPPGAVAVTYDTVYRFDRVAKARQDWERFKSRLRTIQERLQE